MTTFERMHTFHYDGKRIDIGYDLDSREHEIDGRIELKAPMRNSSIYIDGCRVLMSTFFRLVLPNALASGEYTELESLIEDYIVKIHR